MLKAYKYRIYPNNEQKIQIAKTFGCCRFVYNQTLAYRKEVYEKEKKSVSKTDCNNYCNRQLKKEYEWLKEVDKFALTNAIYNMDAAYRKFFKEHAGYPKFKSKHDNHKSYTTNFIIVWSDVQLYLNTPVSCIIPVYIHSATALSIFSSSSVS